MNKRKVIRQVFDSNLYYENGMYQTPTMIPLLARNHLKMREKCLLNFQEKRDFDNKIPLSGIPQHLSFSKATARFHYVQQAYRHVSLHCSYAQCRTFLFLFLTLIPPATKMCKHYKPWLRNLSPALSLSKGVAP